MLTDRGLFGVAVFLYGVSFLYSIFLLRQGFRQDNRANYLLILGGFAFHTVAMFARGFRLDRCPIHNLYEATIFTLWTIAAVYLVSGLWQRVRFLGAFASPLLFGGGVFALMPSLDKESTYTGGLVSAHAAMIALAYGAFGLSFVAGAMYLVQDRNLKFHKLRAALSLLPPIQRLEHLMSGLMIAGFVQLTVGLGLAPLLVKQHDLVGALSGDPKILWSAFVWLVYLAMIVARWFFGQQGKRLAWAVVFTFVFVMTTFWGFNLLSPVHNP